MKNAEQKMIEANAKLLTRGDDSEVVCHEHNLTRRWGDLDPIVQLAVLAGLDVEGADCIMAPRRTVKVTIKSMKRRTE
jgi:hypothetical protein